MDEGESSPLVGPQVRLWDGDGEPQRDLGELGRLPGGGREPQTLSTGGLVLLTLSIGGLQIVWSVELSSGSVSFFVLYPVGPLYAVTEMKQPYLLSLGMSKALLAFVWIAGPLSGTLVQPYIGVRSDNCRISWGKRKPFMLAGAAATIVALMALAWVQEVVGGVMGVFGAGRESTAVRTTIIVVATGLMYILDFAINTVQAGIRCFIVDNAPTHQQPLANAWASRLTGVGNILGYIFGYINLPRALPFLGKTRFQILCAIASIALTVTLAISCYYIQERDPRLDGPPASTDQGGIVAFAKQVVKSVRHLPPQIAKVCEVQLAAWMGWFPFLFYATTYIGQLYVNPIFEAEPNMSDGDIDDAWERATRIGTFALLIYAVISFVANITLPVFVVPDNKQHHAASEEEEEEEEDIPQRQSQVWTLLSRLQIPGFTLRRAWLLSHVLFAGCMFSTFFVSSYQAGSVAIGLVGITWAVALWAPFALISAEVSRIDAECRDSAEQDSEGGGGEVPGGRENLAQAGIVLGLHNVAISAPQIISSLICSAIFKAAQKPRGEPWDDSVGWVLRFGGCAAIGAAWLTSRLAE